MEESTFEGQAVGSKLIVLLSSRRRRNAPAGWRSGMKLSDVHLGLESDFVIVCNIRFCL